MLLESGEDVDQRDQVLVSSSLYNFAKPEARLLAGLGILTFFSMYCRGFTSNSLAERRGTRYLSLHLVVL